MKARRLGRRRGSVAAAKKGLQLSRSEIAALAIAALVGIAGFSYLAVTYKGGGGAAANYVGETVAITITLGPNNITPIYFPANFTVGLGQHVTVDVTNLLSSPYGMALSQPDSKPNVDTGPISPQNTAAVSFVASVAGNYTISEPASDCGGGSCNSHSDLVGWYLVTSTP